MDINWVNVLNSKAEHRNNNELYASPSCLIILNPAHASCVWGAASRAYRQDVLISYAWPQAMRSTLNPERQVHWHSSALYCEAVTSLSQIPSLLLSASLPRVGVITLRSQSMLNPPLHISIPLHILVWAFSIILTQGNHNDLYPKGHQPLAPKQEFPHLF